MKFNIVDSRKMENDDVRLRFDSETTYWKSNSLVDIIAWERKRRLEIMLDWVSRSKYSAFTNKKVKVLEIGCGAGHNLIALADMYPAWNFTGVDISPVMIDTCKKIYVRRKNISFSVLNIDKDTLSRKYDIIILLGVVGYLSNERVAMQNVSHMLTKGGLLIFTHGRVGASRFIRNIVAHVVDFTPITRLYNSFKRILNSQAIPYNPSANAFTAYYPNRIDSTLKKNGIAVIESKNLCYVPGLLGRLSILFSRVLEFVFQNRDPFSISMTRIVHATKKK